MIPKVIHYCWFGKNELPQRSKEYIATWRKYCPDYQIIEWNENNYDIHKNRYMEEAYHEGKWSFVSDYARLDIVYENGGIYLDTDVEILKSLDIILKWSAFFAFEVPEFITTGLGFGAEKNNTIVKYLRDMYDHERFKNIDGRINLTPCPYYVTEGLRKKGFITNNQFQEIDNVVVYPQKYFNPMDFKTGKILVEKETISIHHYDMTWMTKKERNKILVSRFVRRIIGNNLYDRIKR